MKVMTIIGTRPEIIKLSETMKELDKYLEHIIVHTGQNYDYELNEIFFEDLELRKPNYFLHAVGDTLAQTIGNIISKSDEVMEKEKPDALLLYGDTNSCLSVISAKRRKIPIFHMEAGNRCFDERVPEEINRKIIDHLADMNFVITEHAKKYLEREGIAPERIIKVGSSMLEIFTKYEHKISDSILSQLKIEAKQYFLVSAHREELVDDSQNLKQLLESLHALIEYYDIPIIFSTHPRTRRKIEKISSHCINPRLVFLKPFGFFDYISLQRNAKCVLSDSGTITEESSLLSFPAVTIRESHERPEGNDEASVIMCGYTKDRIFKAVEIVTKQFEENEQCIQRVKDYVVDNVSKKIVRLIVSYTEYINKKVWSKKEF